MSGLIAMRETAVERRYDSRKAAVAGSLVVVGPCGRRLLGSVTFAFDAANDPAAQNAPQSTIGCDPLPTSVPSGDRAACGDSGGLPSIPGGG